MKCYCRKCGDVFDNNERLFYCHKCSPTDDNKNISISKPKTKKEIYEQYFKRCEEINRQPLHINSIRETENYTDLETEAKIINSAVEYTMGVPKVGVYFLLDAKYNIIYIGKSTDIDTRLRFHTRDKIPFKFWYWIKTYREEMDIKETQYINRFMPILNISKNPKKNGLTKTYCTVLA